MLLLAMSIGVAAVVALTSLGEGARGSMWRGNFRRSGTRLVIVIPGRSETGGVAPGLLSGETPRDLTLGDAEAVLRIPEVERVAPLVIGSAPVSAGALEREAPVLGSSADFLTIYGFELTRGQFLPAGELTRDAAVCVIGANIARELFPGRDAIGASCAHRRSTLPRRRRPRRPGTHDRSRFAGDGGHSGQRGAGAVQHGVAVPVADPDAQPRRR